MEIRLHGRGGQGGVTCAKLLAATWAGLGKSVQAFGDYSGERSGAPVRAYLRVDDTPIVNRNKVYSPDHLLVLDHALLDETALAGLVPGGTVVVNTPDGPDVLAGRFPGFRFATVDATRIARAHGIGSRSLVIVNTTIAGAFARAMELPLDALMAALVATHVESDAPAARQAWEEVRIHGPVGTPRHAAPPPASAPVMDLVDHVEGAAPALRTGSWRSSAPRYVTRAAPCAQACPAGNDVIHFVQALATGGPEAGAAVLAATTPFASVCGRVCPGFCEQSCNRAAYDGAVDTRGLERWIGDHATIARPAAVPQGRRAAVVGAGPAGMSAAYQLARAGWAVDLYDADAAPGGLLRTGIPPWRLPRVELDREIDAVLAIGVTFHGGQRANPDTIAALAAGHDAVVIATGLARPTGIALADTPLNGVEQGLDYLRAANSGLAMQQGGHVVVVGGGNTAIDCARTALRRGAEKVTVVYRRTRDQMPAIAEEVEEAEEEGVHFLFLRGPVALYGDDHVGGIELAVMESETRGGRPVDTGRRDWLDCDAVLLALGSSADPAAILPAGWTLRDGQAHDGDRPLHVFAAGDLSTNEGTVAHAIGDGARVAARARAWVGEPLVVAPRKGPTVRADEVRIAHFQRRAAPRPRRRPPEERVRNGEEVSLGLADAHDAEACMSCGHCTHCDTCLVLCPDGVIRRADGAYAVDLTQCKGCGLCARECPRGAMEMVSS